MTLEDAIDVLLSGGPVGPADDAVAAAQAAGAQQLIARLLERPLGRDALSPAGAFNLGRLKRICQVLSRIDWPGLVEALDDFLKSPRGNVRELMAKTLVERGNSSAAAVAERLLAATDRETVRGAFEGIEDAQRTKRADPEFRRRVFDLMAAEVRGRDRGLNHPVRSSPAELMMHLDPARGAELLTSDVVLRADHPAIVDVLRAIERFKLDVPAARLLALAPRLRSTSGIPPLLASLARIDPTAVQPFLMRSLDHDDRDIREQAFESWLATRGIDLFELNRRQKKDSTLLALAALHQILGITGADGLAAAIEQVPARQWTQAIELAQRAGATVTAEHLAAALELGTSYDDPYGLDDEVLEPIEDALFDDDERLHRRLHNLLVDEL